MEGAAGAERPLAAVLLGVLDNEGVVLVEKLYIGGEVLHEEGAHLLVTLPAVDNTETGKEPFGVGVHNESGLAACIEQYGVGRLRPYPPHLNELTPHLSPIRP